MQGLVFFSIFGSTSFAADPIILIEKTKSSVIIHSLYIDDILLTGSDDTSILAAKTYLQD